MRLETQVKKTQTFTPVRRSLLQRSGAHACPPGKCDDDRKKRSLLQRRPFSGTEPATVPPIVTEVLRAPGLPLDPGARASMEPRFGHDFSRVRVHTDARAAESARAVNAPPIGTQQPDHPSRHPNENPTRVSSFVRSALGRAAGGHAVTHSVRKGIEAERGVDLSHVRVHSNPHAGAMAQNAGAIAVAYGDDIFITPEWYQPGTSTGRSLLLHELNHVADQLVYSSRDGDRPSQIARYPNQRQAGSSNDYLEIVRSVEAEMPEAGPAATLQALRRHIESEYRGVAGFRYFETDTRGWIDIVHFTTAAEMAASYGEVLVDVLGFGLEVRQWITEWGDDYRSGFSPEDIPSNSAGSDFGDDVFDPEGDRLSTQLERYINRLQPVSPASSATYQGLPVEDVSGRPSGTSSASSQPTPTGAQAACEPQYLGMGDYLGSDCIIRPGPGPKF